MALYPIKEIAVYVFLRCPSSFLFWCFWVLLTPNISWLNANRLEWLCSKSCMRTLKVKTKPIYDVCCCSCITKDITSDVSSFYHFNIIISWQNLYILDWHAETSWIDFGNHNLSKLDRIIISKTLVNRSTSNITDDFTWRISDALPSGFLNSPDIYSESIMESILIHFVDTSIAICLTVIQMHAVTLTFFFTFRVHKQKCPTKPWPWHDGNWTS